MNTATTDNRRIKKNLMSYCTKMYKFSYVFSVVCNVVYCILKETASSCKVKMLL